MTVMDVLGPVTGACVFVLAMSRVREPTRRTLNAVIVAGASGVYLSGGFGLWEVVYPVVVTPVVYRALYSYRYVGVAWLMHAAWDLSHHFWGNPIWPFMPTSSFGCFVFDSLIAIWFWVLGSRFWVLVPGSTSTRLLRGNQGNASTP